MVLTKSDFITLGVFSPGGALVTSAPLTRLHIPFTHLLINSRSHFPPSILSDDKLSSYSTEMTKATANKQEKNCSFSLTNL